jgi:hypothetical protein
MHIKLLKHLKHNSPAVRHHLTYIIGKWRFFIIPVTVFIE